MTPEPSCSPRPMMSAPSAAPGIEPMPPMMTTTSEASRKRMSSPGEIDWKGPPTPPAMPAAGPQHDHEPQLKADPHRCQNAAVIDAGAHDHPDTRAIEREPHRNAD